MGIAKAPQPSYMLITKSIFYIHKVTTPLHLSLGEGELRSMRESPTLSAPMLTALPTRDFGIGLKRLSHPFKSEIQ
jgi:hypothetical protein